MSGCNYTLTENTNGLGGELQSDVTTKLLCQSRCDGDGLPNDLQCYAYDWETGSSHCFIFTSQDYTMNEEGSTPGVNHNKKDTTCIGKTVISEKCHIFTPQYQTRRYNNGYTCNCVAGYTGDQCQTRRYNKGYTCNYMAGYVLCRIFQEFCVVKYLQELS